MKNIGRNTQCLSEFFEIHREHLQDPQKPNRQEGNVLQFDSQQRP